MTTPTGTIGLYDVNIELGRPGTQYIQINDSGVRALSGTSVNAYMGFNTLRGKSSYAPMTVTPHSYGGGQLSSASAGTAYVYPSVSVTGGSGGYTYLWTITSRLAGNPTLSDNTSYRPTLSQSYARFANGSFDVYLQCVVTDSTQHSVTVTQIEASVGWGNAM